jgi:glycosyltransferase involved in cell wall biosynthesis
MSTSDFPVSSCITVSLPYYGAKNTIRRAVTSLLAQTYREILVIVINDGDRDPPWRMLSDIRDPRLIFFDLSKNWGPYFAHEVALRACKTRFFSIHDADDWSSRDRMGKLFDGIRRDRSDFAFSAEWQYLEKNGKLYYEGVRWKSPAKSKSGDHFIVDRNLSNRFVNRASHHGLFKTEFLRAVGGYYGGFRLNYDTLLTNILLMAGKSTFIEDPLYAYIIHDKSLSNSISTGARSEARYLARQKQELIYQEALQIYKNYLIGRSSSMAFFMAIRALVRCHISSEAERALQYESGRLEYSMRQAQMI